MLELDFYLRLVTTASNGVGKNVGIELARLPNKEHTTNFSDVAVAPRLV